VLKSLEAASNVVAGWNQFSESRAPEFLNPIPGYEGLSREVFEEIFEGWVFRLRSVSGARWIESAEAEVTDMALAARIGGVVGHIQNAISNGVQWLYSSGFVDSVAVTSQMVATFTDRRASIAGQLAKELKREGVSEIGSILTAADAADVVTTSASIAAEHLASAEQSATGAQKSAVRIVALASDLDAARTQITEAQAYSKGKREEIEALFGEVVSVKVRAEAAANDLAGKAVDLGSQVGAAVAQSASAVADLKGALRDVRRQGLAGAFSSRADKLRAELRTWILIFCGALICLAAAAVALGVELSTFSYEALLVAILRRLAIAAPLVWIGWYAAKQISRINRIREDYEYKAATALAFDSYKKEVEASNDGTLMAKLLATAITNFGENPARFYGNEHKEPSTPTEDLISQIEKDGTFKLFLGLKKLFDPSSK